jgi:hypothetical protein
MKWFRSNIRLGSRVALFALAIQFLLSFGHFHGGIAQAESASVGANRAGLHEAATQPDAQPAPVAGPIPLKTPSGHVPSGQPSDDCAICATIALANTMVDAAPPCLSAPQTDIFQYLASDAALVDENNARVAFQPRAPPIT